ncbi:MAG: precorrin-6Y C5,15-methyltransferase (decarboxylating) subunit CbiT [Clostridiales bacterium]|nr:precorrin-6Y C5,15-methyltransferase (decarboxylating) subunit CbiT [Clostridiales bacterium]
MRDECFIRGEIPMTKSEIRAVSLDKLELRPDHIIWDVGAGTGSVSVEMALRVPRGHVFAVEQKEEGCRLIRDNCEKFAVENVTVCEGRAPEILMELPVPDRVFIGGSGGRLREILDILRQRNPLARIVVNLITLESLAQLHTYLRERGLEAEIVCLQVSRARKMGEYHLMRGENPVWIVTIIPSRADESEEDR